jgi:hypothetical protein
MNTEKKIERCLRAAPKPPVQEALLDKLQQDVALGEIETQRSVLRRWIAPTGGRISLWRLAAAAAVAIAVLLPLSYGAVKAVKHFVIARDQVTFEYPEDNSIYTVSRSIAIAGNNTSSEEAKRKLEEFRELYDDGKAEEVKPGVWVATLSNGEKFAYVGDPERIGVEFTEQEQEQLKEQFDEINELRKAGKYEKTYKPENDFIIYGVKHRYFEAHYTLSDGRVVTLGASEPAEDEN